jgi:hypothetical protein
MIIGAITGTTPHGDRDTVLPEHAFQIGSWQHGVGCARQEWSKEAIFDTWSKTVHQPGYHAFSGLIVGIKVEGVVVLDATQDGEGVASHRKCGQERMTDMTVEVVG